MIRRYENAVCGVDPALFKADEYCFFVLARILNGACRLTITDKRGFVICHSCDPYPVWIWLPDRASEEEMERIYQTVKENFGLDGRYRFNTKYFFAEYMTKRAKEEHTRLKIVQNLFAYHCLNPIVPKKTADGSMIVASMTDLDEATELIAQFQEDVAIDKESDVAEYRKKAEFLIAAKQFFFWVDEKGEKVATCSYTVAENKASLGQVFTKKEKRRRGYAANLVYEVTERILAQGKTPILYTDADYAPSNACYKEIGYEKKGELCTLE